MDIQKERDFVNWLRDKIDNIIVQINRLQLDKEDFEEKLKIEVEECKKLGIDI